MDDKFQIILIAALVGVAAIRLYKKYQEKQNGGAPGSQEQKSWGKKSKSDEPNDYEPYSKS
jgi:hypothetical protein